MATTTDPDIFPCLVCKRLAFRGNLGQCRDCGGWTHPDCLTLCPRGDCETGPHCVCFGGVHRNSDLKPIDLGVVLGSKGVFEIHRMIKQASKEHPGRAIKLRARVPCVGVYDLTAAKGYTVERYNEVVHESGPALSDPGQNVLRTVAYDITKPVSEE